MKRKYIRKIIKVTVIVTLDIFCYRDVIPIDEHVYHKEQNNLERLFQWAYFITSPISQVFQNGIIILKTVSKWESKIINTISIIIAEYW